MNNLTKGNSPGQEILRQHSQFPFKTTMKKNVFLVSLPGEQPMLYRPEILSRLTILSYFVGQQPNTRKITTFSWPY